MKEVLNTEKEIIRLWNEGLINCYEFNFRMKANKLNIKLYDEL